MLLTGTMSTQLGQWTQQVGQSWLVYQLTKSTLQLGLVSFATGFAMMVFSPVGGALADRMDRRKLMLISQAGLMAVSIALAVLVASHHIRTWQIYITSVVSGLLFAINGPSRQSVIYALVGKQDLANAIALNSIGQNLARVAGPALGGLLLATAGVPGVYSFQAGSYIVAMGTLMTLRQDLKPDGQRRETFAHSLTDGLRYARRESAILMLLLIALTATFFGMGYSQLMPAYAAKVLNLTTSDSGSGYGFLMVSVGAGAIVGSLLVVVMGQFHGQGKLLLGAVAVVGIMLLALGLNQSPVIAVILLAGVGMGTSLWMALNNTLLQIAVSNEYRGRVMSLYFLTFGFTSFGGLLGGAVAQRIGVGYALAIMGGLLTVMAIAVALGSPRLRRM